LKQKKVMKILEFQSESPSFAIAQRTERLPAAYNVTAESSRAAIESLLIGQCLRDWLTDSEKNFLDFLVPQDALLFIIKEGHFLHPEDTELFPLELIETALNEGGEAFFSHRLHTNSDTTNNHYRVHTAHIQSTHGEPLILGMLCPDNPVIEFEYTNCFCDLVISFRKAAENIDELTSALQTKYNTEIPTLLINRSSGRLLSANPAATTLLNLPERQLADLEYHRFKHRLADIMAGFRIEMDNIPQGENSLTVMTFTSEKPVSKNNDPFLVNHFLNTMLDKISSTTTAASYLGSLTDIGRDTEETELIEMILNEIKDMERNLNRFYILANCRNLPSQSVNLRNELEQAVEKIRKGYDADYTIEIIDELSPVECRAPRLAYLCLFESTLLAHEDDIRKSGTTTVRLNPATGENMAVVFETEVLNYDEESLSGRHWLKYSRLLAKNLGLNLIHNYQDKARKIITNIIIPNQDSER